MKFFVVFHKWFGLGASIFVVLFALSGIFLNHREAISGLDVSRAMLPSKYQYKNWNNSSVKGTLKINNDSILVYGGSGLWLTDSIHSGFSDYSQGMRSGADNKNILNVVKTSEEELFALASFRLYRFNANKSEWNDITKSLDADDRFADMTTRGDSIIVMSRSHIYISVYPYNIFEKKTLPTPANYQHTIPLFKAMWTLHSGEMFGILGKLVIDVVGVVFIILCVSGVIIMFFPGIIRKIKEKKKKKKLTGILKSNHKWHNKLGAWFLIIVVFVTLSGVFLRPPAMILIIKDRVSPIPGSEFDTSNAWFDKLRTIKYDSYAKEWLLYTSDGFYSFADFNSIPEPIHQVPRISVMGVNVLEERAPGLWIVGSFNGLYYWDRVNSRYVDVLQMRPAFLNGERIGQTLVESQHGVIESIDVSGYSSDFTNKELVFSYSKGAISIGNSDNLGAMPPEIQNGSMSLWHLSLETHVGRIYTFMVGSLLGESLFILISGLLIIFILISGYIVYRKKYKKKAK